MILFNDFSYTESQHKCCLGTKHYFHCDNNMIIRSVESESNFLSNGMVKTRSHIVQNMVYIRKTYVKLCHETSFPSSCGHQSGTI